MTDENKALLGEMFQRYGHRSNEAQIDIRSYFIRAETLNETGRIQLYDESAVRLIQKCEETIAQLKAYRISLAERYSFLATSPSVPVVRLVRIRNSYDSKVYYHLLTLRRFLEDGTEVEESREKYPGSERRKAIADYKAYVKAHPGIAAEMDIEKKRWEK